MIPFKSVKFRLTLWYAFILTIFLSLFAFLMHAELARALHEDADDNLLQEVRLIEASMQPYLKKIGKDQTALKEWEKKTNRLNRSTFIIRLAGLDHRMLLNNLKGWEKEILFPNYERDSVFMETGQSLQTIHFQNRPIRLHYSLVRRENQPLFLIQAGIPIDQVENTLRRLAFIILILIPGAVAAACVVGWFLVKRSFQPVDQLIREANQITAAYLPKRLPRTHIGDELDRLAETLNEMLDRLEISTRAIQDFSSDISHELKTPLAIIRGEIDLALRKVRSPETLTETLHVIEGEVNELIRLVDDLILLVRSDAKQLRFEMKPVSLNKVLRQVAERFKERALAKRIDFSFDLNSEAMIRGDEVYLKRLFFNLLDNALKFTPEQGSINLRLRAGDPQIYVEVSDTGMGIEVEMQSKVFSRFYRTDQARSHEGAGLGLNIAKTITDSHQGSIHIESYPGRGTKVTVQFPAFSPLD